MVIDISGGWDARHYCPQLRKESVIVAATLAEAGAAAINSEARHQHKGEGSVVIEELRKVGALSHGFQQRRADAPAQLTIGVPPAPGQLIVRLADGYYYFVPISGEGLEESGGSGLRVH